MLCYRGGISLNIQFKKGALELCVLALLSRKDCYGFELVSTLSSCIGMSEGTVYPLLKRLKDDGRLTTYLVESNEGPPRKYYRVSAKGREDYAELRGQWREFAAQVDSIIGGVGAGENGGRTNDSGCGASDAGDRTNDSECGAGENSDGTVIDNHGGKENSLL